MLAQTIIVLEIVSLILKGVEGLIFDFPTRSAGPHDPVDVVLAKGNVGYPAEPFRCAILIQLPIFKDIDSDVGVGGIDR